MRLLENSRRASLPGCQCIIGTGLTSLGLLLNLSSPAPRRRVSSPGSSPCNRFYPNCFFLCPLLQSARVVKFFCKILDGVFSEPLGGEGAACSRATPVLTVLSSLSRSAAVCASGERQPSRVFSNPPHSAASPARQSWRKNRPSLFAALAINAISMLTS